MFQKNLGNADEELPIQVCGASRVGLLAWGFSR
jgi:hypothetical protein